MSSILTSTRLKSGNQETGLNDFWATPFGSVPDPTIPNLPIEITAVTFAADISESPDVVAANVRAIASLSAAITESPDVVAANLNAIATLSAAITETSDTVAASVTVGSTASISAAITESSDVVAANLNAVIGLSAAITETSDTVAGAVSALVTASAAITESPDVVAANLNALIRVSAAITETADTVSATLNVVTPATITAAITESPDTVAATINAADNSVLVGGGHAWKGPVEPEYRVHPEYEQKKPKKKRVKKEGQQVILAGEPEIQTGVIEVTPAWDALGDLQAQRDEAEKARLRKLRQLALADDEWLMVA